MAARYTLSKSTFLRGLQCHKSLYLNRFHRDLATPPDAETQAVFKTGRHVGELARGLFPGGAVARAAQPWNMAQAVRRTQQLLQEGESILYEAAFQHNGVLALVDMLVHQPDGWHLYEVKSTTSVKPVHLPDAGVQAYILDGVGIELADVSIVYLNNQYIRQGELDLRQLFIIESVKEQVEALQAGIDPQVAELNTVLQGGVVPQIEIGPHCFDPYDCDFIAHCWSDVPQGSVFEVARMRKSQAFELYRQGIVRIEEIPADFPLSTASLFHVENRGRGEPIIDREAIRGFLESLSYPLYFLDFETYNPAIPPFSGTRPYGHIPFQYSLHLKQTPTSELEHYGFLAEAGSDPRPQLVESLLRDTRGAGEVLVYYEPFEGERLRELAEQLPEHGDELEALRGRLRDLIVPFQRRYYYHPAQEGSNSIKAVLPALVPNLGYSDLAITAGSLAMLAYADLHAEQDLSKVEQIRKDLWEYCKRDTLAMVRILETLESLL